MMSQGNYDCICWRPDVPQLDCPLHRHEAISENPYSSETVTFESAEDFMEWLDIGGSE